MRPLCKNMERDKSTFLINTITKENLFVTRDKVMVSYYFSMTQSIKANGLKGKNMEWESIKTSHLVSTIKANGSKVKEMVLDIYKSKDRADTKALSPLTTELAMERKNFQMMTATKESIRWANFMEKVCMFGLRVLVMKEIFIKD